jgi:ADP-ribose pyrophosphatase YjhB (NUDIX family)
MSQTPQNSGSFERKIPEGDTRPRLVCTECGFVQYENPKIVIGSVCQWAGRVLLGRRTIEPRAGYWTIPAGYLELGETTPNGAIREAWEETRARIEILALLGVYSIPRISQVQLIYRARLISPDVEPGDETSEVGLFEWDSIPWEELAFPSVHWALRHNREVEGKSEFAPRSNPPGELGDYPGAGS